MRFLDYYNNYNFMDKIIRLIDKKTILDEQDYYNMLVSFISNEQDKNNFIKLLDMELSKNINYLTKISKIINQNLYNYLGDEIIEYNTIDRDSYKTTLELTDTMELLITYYYKDYDNNDYYKIGQFYL